MKTNCCNKGLKKYEQNMYIGFIFYIPAVTLAKVGLEKNLHENTGIHCAKIYDFRGNPTNKEV